MSATATLRGMLGLAAIVAVLLAVTVVEAAAQQRPPQDVVGRRMQGRWPSSQQYYRSTRRPYQGSFTRRWQDKLERQYGGMDAGRGVPRDQWAPIFVPPPRERVFVHPPDRDDRCGPISCHRRWQREQRQWGHGWGWHGWNGPLR